MTTKSLRAGTLSFGEYILGFSHKEVGTHSIQSWFSMELYLFKFYPLIIMIVSRYNFSRYSSMANPDRMEWVLTSLCDNSSISLPK